MFYYLKKVFLIKLSILFGIIFELIKCRENFRPFITDISKLQVQKAINRTLTKIQSMGDEERLIVLICKTTCLKQRAQVFF